MVLTKPTPIVLFFAVAASTVHSLVCRKINPSYSSDAIPPFTGSAGPFGSACEVTAESGFPDLPAIPTDLAGKAMVIRSSFPDHFMDTSMVPLRVHAVTLPSATIKSASMSAGVVSSGHNCGEGMSVHSVHASMDEKVIGISGGSGLWLGACVKCGQDLERRTLLQPGWFCEIGRIVGIPSGIWLKRSGDSTAHTVDVVKVESLTPWGPPILGFGGAFTDAVSVATDLLNGSLKQAWLDGYFGSGGAGYTVARVHFGGCDFSRRAYSLMDDAPGDLLLKSMCLKDDRDGAKCGEDAKISVIKAALEREPQLKIFFSPWSAPAWMKTTNKLVGGRIRGLGPGKGQWTSEDLAIADAWASSYVKFADLYAAEGVKLWGLTLQNEPGADQFVSWNAISVSGEEELDLVNRLGPKMRAAHPHIKIIVHDDQVYSLKDRLVKSGAGILESEFVDGVAFHWYGSLAGTFENVTAEHAVKPLPIGPAAFGGGLQVREIYNDHIKGTDKFLLGTEACTGYAPAILHTLKDPFSESNNRGVRPGDWYRGYRYSRDIFYQLDNGASGWTDWNMMLRSDGGPNWAGNNVDAPIIVSPNGSALWVSPMFFHIAHFSRYVVPGSRALTIDRSSSELQEVGAYLRPDGRVVVVALCDQLDGHGSPPASRMLRVQVGSLEVELEVLSASIVTAIFDVPDNFMDIIV